MNDQKSPVVEISSLEFHGSGDLLSIGHNARNQFSIITIAHLTVNNGNLESEMFQATSDRFNCYGAYFSSSTMYFMSDKDITTDVSSPWGTRTPMPHFKKPLNIYALPLTENEAAMIQIPELQVYQNIVPQTESLENNEVVTFSFDFSDLIERSHRLEYIREASYITILCAGDDYLALLKTVEDKYEVILYVTEPNSIPEEMALVSVEDLESIGVSCNRNYFYLITGEELLVVKNDPLQLLRLKDGDVGQAFTSNLSLQIQPQLEYISMYDDAWRLLHDYFYDKNMHGVDWEAVYSRYKPLVSRCAKREDLDDVLRYMASELSALHVFVYGGEYNAPIPTLIGQSKMQEVSSLGAVFHRNEIGYENRVNTHKDIIKIKVFHF